ncbi:MAG TPA: hypothetical protein VFU47_07795, partial [Armatimonadota bacterium]|nr:hypothetical protein [Armatimonadota bacterium]
RMMDWGRKNFQPVFFARKGEQVGMARVSGGIFPSVQLVAANDLSAIVRRHPGNNPEREIRAERTLGAPVRQDQVGGTLVGMVGGRPVGQVDVVAAQPVSQIWTASVAPWTGWSMGLALLLLGPRYVRAFAKGARRRRRGFAKGRGDADLQRESLG